MLDQGPEQVAQLFAICEPGKGVMQRCVFKISTALSQCVIRPFLLFQRLGKLTGMTLGLTSSFSFGHGLCSFGFFHLVDGTVNFRD